MNERIEELAQQCTEQLIDYDVGTMYDQVDYRKLAELIVRECADYVQFYYKDHACEIIAHDMKQHFGVE